MLVPVTLINFFVVVNVTLLFGCNVIGGWYLYMYKIRQQPVTDFDTIQIKELVWAIIMFLIMIIVLLVYKKYAYG